MPPRHERWIQPIGAFVCQEKKTCAYQIAGRGLPVMGWNRKYAGMLNSGRGLKKGQSLNEGIGNTNGFEFWSDTYQGEFGPVA